jgi:hypothetical protein
MIERIQPMPVLTWAEINFSFETETMQDRTWGNYLQPLRASVFDLDGMIIMRYEGLSIFSENET